MRSATGTKSEPSSFVTRWTKETIAFLGAVSFHDGNGSSAAVAKCTNARLTTSTVHNEMRRGDAFIPTLPFELFVFASGATVFSHCHRRLKPPYHTYGG